MAPPTDWLDVRTFPSAKVAGVTLHVNPTPSAEVVAQFGYRPARSGLLVTGEVAVLRGQPVLSSIYIGPAGSSVTPIDSSHLRLISVPTLLAGVQTLLANLSQLGSSWPAAAALAAASSRRVGPGRTAAGYPPGHYRRIALAAVNLQSKGERGILRQLAAQENVPVETLRYWIDRARDEGFLSPGTRGRASFTPGPNLYTSKEK